MTFTFAPAVRTSTPMIIGIAGPSGSGKTYTALNIALGLGGVDPQNPLSWPGKIAFGDTEGGRAKHYAPAPGEDPDFVNTFPFDHVDIEAPYEPRRFLEVLQAARHPVIIIDSFSDEYVGEGGLVDMAAASRVSNEAAKWATPKAEHKLVVRWLRQSRCHVIFCLRAEEKVKIVQIDQEGNEVSVPAFRPDIPGYRRGPGIKSVVVPIGWQPICEKNVPYEMATSFMLVPEARGVPRPIKIQEQHRHLFPIDRPITRETGVALAAWCAGGAAPKLNTTAKAPTVFRTVPGAVGDWDMNPQLGPLRRPAEPADEQLLDQARYAATSGTQAFRSFYFGLSDGDRTTLKPDIRQLQDAAKLADKTIHDFVEGPDIVKSGAFKGESLIDASILEQKPAVVPPAGAPSGIETPQSPPEGATTRDPVEYLNA